MDRRRHAAAAVQDVGHLYVSRAALHAGRLAGEAYLERALRAVGVRGLRPETVSLAGQIAPYRRAASRIFAEGSAVHALQLMRRPVIRMARASLAPRVRRLRCFNVLRGLVYGRRASGQRYRTRGISFLDGPALVERFAALGVPPLAEVWEEAAFAVQRDDDVALWMEHTRALALHPGAMATVEGRLRRSRL